VSFNLKETTRSALLKRGLRLEYATLAWNVVGAIVVIAAAGSANSVALIGFGIDSLIEIFASLVVVWELRGTNADRRRVALRGVSIAFFAQAAYVLFQVVYTFSSGTQPAQSNIGLVWLTGTLIVMLLLARVKHNTGKQLNNPVLLSEARVTLVDGVLAGAVVAGLALNALFGWWWADPLAALLIVYYGVREGFRAWHENRLIEHAEV
jgi:divalent metal cation (Fe/Co/Zn/Cd) transporter